MIEHDFPESLGFLLKLYPEGPWMLTAISPDKKSIDTRTFYEVDEIIPWLQSNKKKNLYYSVNPPIKEAANQKKLQKTEIAYAHYLHVDIDPRENEDLEEERRRITDLLLGYKIEPTFIVFSGGGCNGLWRLSEPIRIAGSENPDEAISQVESRNRQLERDLGGDSCFDICRILRIPGTVNWPTEVKLRKGRTASVASIAHEADRNYPIDLFFALANPSPNIPQTASVKPDLLRVESLDTIRPEIPEKLKVIITQGFDPEKPNRWPSRSEGLFYVCCELVRCGLPDPVIMGIITDKQFLISSSVVEQGTKMIRYAVKQVQKARDHAEHPMLAKMNSEHAVILSFGGDTVVMTHDGRVNPRTKHVEPVFQKFSAFKSRIKHYPKLEIGKKSISAFDWWTGHARRKQYVQVVFEPGEETPGLYNLWKGFAFDAKPGDAHLRYLEHVYENICSGNDRCYEYLIKWMARAVQHPRTQSMVAPVLLGSRGTGKSIFCNFFGAIFEPHKYVASDVRDLTGKFNAHLGQCLLVIAEEAFALRDKRHESVLKELITGQTISIEQKGVDRIQLSNYIHLIMTSNNERVVPAGDHERRFFVLKVSDVKQQNEDYFGPIIKDMNGEGPSNLLHHLMSEDLSKFSVFNIPRTDALRMQQEHSLSTEREWLLKKLEAGSWLRNTEWEGPIVKLDLYEDYRSYAVGLNARFVMGHRAFHNFMMAEIPEAFVKQIWINADHRPLVFYFPSLEECRIIWDKTRGWKSKWLQAEKTTDVVSITGDPF